MTTPPASDRRPTRFAPTRSRPTPREREAGRNRLPSGDASRRADALLPLLLGCGLALGTPVPAAAAVQSSAGTPGLGALPDLEAATMEMKLERTIFKVDVLTLGVRVDSATAADLDAVVDTASGYDDAVEARLAERALRADEAVGEIEFLRGASLGQFLDGVRDDMRKAVDAGWLEPAGYRAVSEGLPEWFGFLRERGIRDGDRISYHVRGDTLRTVYSDPAGDVLLDQTDVGLQHRRALLGAWLAPGSSFREDLIRSLWEAAGG